jgi:very-short-patch-repair endonuclease
VNKKEAEAVVEEIKNLVLKNNYQGTIGVVSPFRSQANLIRDLAYENSDLNKRLVEMDFLVDTVHKFQGDERDVMFFSPTVSNGTGPGAIKFLNSNPNLFNVAITRARSALIVVGDRFAASTSGVSYLEGFSEYLKKLSDRPKPEKEFKNNFGPEYPTVSKPELVSDWEKVFYKALYATNIKTIPQYEIDRYILDFALINGERRLNIEVDGERYHRSWDGELCKRDQIRNQHMIELGWDVKRFWVYEIRDDLNGCVNRVRAWLDQRS